ncbi:transporter substrate-binding domain-containing protein [Patescibacteria group bacterium]|nr:transporter substrate-binding domain-containing protein [Patescibacteria group bacterium]MBU1868308.1 transporter substrate-binding domain-containing protein [Patescibacteria group bacterium]
MEGIGQEDLNEDMSSQFSVTADSELSVEQPSRRSASFASKPFFWVALLLLTGALIWGVYYFLGVSRSELAKQETVGPSVQRIIDRGILIIGTEATFPPMEYKDEGGKLIGYDIDLGNRIAQELGVVAEFRDIAWDDLFSALVDGPVDVVLAGYSITEERQKMYSFSEPYLNAGQVIITQKTNTDISSTNDLNGMKIGTQKDTTNETEALKYTSEDLVISYDSPDEATKALVLGKVDAVFADLTNAKSMITDNPGLKIASDPFTSDYYGVVIRKEESDLKTKIDSILNTLRQRGILILLKKKWLE